MRASIAPMASLATALLIALSSPAVGQVLVSSNPVQEHSVVAGERYEGRIELTNTSSVPQEAKLYQTDYFAAADGRVGYGDAGSSPRSNSAWITIGHSQLVIPPGARTTVSYVITVPAGAALSGTYWSMIMVEGVDRASEESTLGGAQAKPGLSVRTKLRYGVQVATHVGGGAGGMRLAFDSVKATTAPEGGRTLTFDFLNSGEHAARLLMSVELFGADGRPLRKLEQQRGLLYPGNSARQTFELGQLPPGVYTAMITADAGRDEMFGAQYTLRF